VKWNLDHVLFDTTSKHRYVSYACLDVCLVHLLCGQITIFGIPTDRNCHIFGVHDRETVDSAIPGIVVPRVHSIGRLLGRTCTLDVDKDFDSEQSVFFE
jgi:hypothetical protein